MYVLRSDMKYQFFFKFSLGKLKHCGYFLEYDETSNKKRLSQTIYTFIWITYSVFVFIPTEIVTLVLNASNLQNFIKVLCDTANHFGGIYKTYIWFKHRKQIALAMKALTDDSYFCEETYEDFKPKEILLKHKMRSEKWTRLFYISVNILVIFMLLTRLYVILFEFEYLKNEDFKSFPPFGDSQVRAVGLLVFQILPLTGWAWIVVGKFHPYTSCFAIQWLIRRIWKLFERYC